MGKGIAMKISNIQILSYSQHALNTILLFDLPPPSLQINPSMLKASFGNCRLER